MTTPKVSILIPIYKVSDFIERCAHSLFLQTFHDIEYVFVNDCTPDDSMSKLSTVMLEYPNRKHQIKIINHETNKGLASTRNTALDNSNGAYISVIDSDDYIEPTMIEELYNKVTLESADIVVSNFIVEYPTYSIEKSDQISNKTEDNFLLMIKQEQSFSCIWNKLIKRELYERADCRVPEGLNYGEDRHVMTRFYYYAKKIVKVEKAFYHYVQYNSNAITKSKGKMHFDNLVLFWKLFDEFLIENKINKQYQNAIELSKAGGKICLMIDTPSYKLRKDYAHIFHIEEKNHIHLFRKGEQLMFVLLRSNQYFLAHILHKILVYKNRNNKKL